MNHESDSTFADASAQAREGPLRALLAADGGALALFDRGGRILAANAPLADALGRPVDTLEGERLAASGLPEAVAERWEGTIRRAASTGQPITVAGLLDGMDVRFVPLRNSDGAAGPVAALLRTSAPPARPADPGPAPGARFLAAAAHDLRQPFQAMHLFHHLLSETVADPRARDLAGKLGQAMEAADALVTAVIDVAKLDAGAIRPEPCVFALDELLGRVVDGHAARAEAAGLRLALRACGLHGRSDPVLLERVLRAFLGNALVHTRRGGILIGARRRGDRARIEVWDTGSGIAPGDLDAVWEDFRQLGPPPRGMPQGSGLGLAVARRIAALLGHPVSARSRPGRGSVFAIEVPVAQGTAPAGG